MNWKRRITMMIWFSGVTALLITFFWFGWYLIEGNVPVRLTSIKMGDQIYTLPFGISRWWDIFIGPICSSILVFMFTPKIRDDEKNIIFVFGLCYGLIAGIFFGLVFGMLFALVFGVVLGMCFGLCVDIDFELGAGILFGLGVGLIYVLVFGVVIGLGVGLIAGMIFGLGVGLGKLVKRVIHKINITIQKKNLSYS